MITALCSGITAFGFWGFLKSAIFLVGYISSNQLFPEPLSPEEERVLFRAKGLWKWRGQKYLNRKKLKISRPYL